MELDCVSTEERLRQLFVVYGCIETEFVGKFLQNNGILQRQNGETATEWWKPSISDMCGVSRDTGPEVFTVA